MADIAYTDEQREYFAREGAKGPTAQLANIRAAVDAEYPDLPEATRELLARERYLTTQRTRAAFRRKNLKTAS
jgi:hypothetical protein